MTMRMPALLLVAAASTVVLAGCGQSDPSARTAGALPGAAQAPRAAAAPAKCEDGLEPNASLEPTTGSGSTIAKIKKRGYLRVATNGDVLAWGATNTTTGNPEGYDVDLAAEIADALGLDPKKTVYTVIPYSRRQDVLDDDRVDLVAQQMTITCDRWQGTPATATADELPAINLSWPYYTAGAKLLVRSNAKADEVKDLKGQKVCGTSGSTSLTAVEKFGLERVEAPSAGQCLVKFEEGEVDAVVGDETTLAGFKAQDPRSKIIGSGPDNAPINPGQYGLGTSAEAPDFTRFVNGVLVDLKADGTLDRLYDKWMKPIVGGSPAAVPEAGERKDLTELRAGS